MIHLASLSGFEDDVRYSSGFRQGRVSSHREETSFESKDVMEFEIQRPSAASMRTVDALAAFDDDRVTFSLRQGDATNNLFD